MDSFSPLMGRLVRTLQVLPGVGPKTASRIALHLVHKDRGSGEELAEALQQAVVHVKECKLCRNVSEQDVCGICDNDRRDSNVICVVESPSDVFAIEHSGGFSGKYFVLHGHLSPIDGIEPSDLRLDVLMQRVKNEEVSELIVATGTTAEGDATAQYISDLLADLNVVVSRIAHGIPVGGELEYVDMSTITRAIRGRTLIESSSLEGGS